MTYTRISGRRGQPLNLDVTFFHGGVATDPYAIRSVMIYKGSVEPHNLVDTIAVVQPYDETYPYPFNREIVDDAEVPGKYILTYVPASDSDVPSVYYDVWQYYAEDPRPEGCVTGDPTECDLEDYESSLITCCHRFWLYPDQWYCTDDLEVINFQFEPLGQKFFSPEVKPLQVGYMPTPLYDFNRALVMPMMPFLRATITVSTQNCELLIDNEDMSTILRTGSYRTNPYVFKWNLDTSRFLKGTYKYRVKIAMPDGSTRVSPDFNFSVM